MTMESRNEAVQNGNMANINNIQTQKQESEMNTEEKVTAAQNNVNSSELSEDEAQLNSEHNLPDTEDEDSEEIGEVKGNEGDSCAAKKRMSQIEKINMLRELALALKNEEQICTCMGITELQFKALYFELCQKDGRYYPIAPTPKTVGTWIRETGIGLTKDQLELLDTHGLFKAGHRANWKTLEDGSLQVIPKEPNEAEKQKWEASQARKEARKNPEIQQQASEINEATNCVSGEANTVPPTSEPLETANSDVEPQITAN